MAGPLVTVALLRGQPRLRQPTFHPKVTVGGAMRRSISSDRRRLRIRRLRFRVFLKLFRSRSLTLRSSKRRSENENSRECARIPGVATTKPSRRPWLVMRMRKNDGSACRSQTVEVRGAGARTTASNIWLTNAITSAERSSSGSSRLVPEPRALTQGSKILTGRPGYASVLALLLLWSSCDRLES
jgi:hypothetical protein